MTTPTIDEEEKDIFKYTSINRTLIFPRMKMGILIDHVESFDWKDEMFKIVTKGSTYYLTGDEAIFAWKFLSGGTKID